MSSSSSSLTDGPPAKKARVQAPCPADSPLLLHLHQTDIWVQTILPYLGGGHYIFLGLVSKRFQELYKKYISSLKNPPMVKEFIMIGDEPAYNQHRLSEIGCTLYSVVLSNPSLAEYWYKLTNGGYMAMVLGLVAKHGNLQVFQMFHRKGFPWDEETCDHAACSGNLACLQYAWEQACPRDNFKHVCVGAAMRGHLDILKWAHSNQCPWNVFAPMKAAKYGHLECLKYTHENGCPWSGLECKKAAESGHLECVKYAHNHGSPWTRWAREQALENGHKHILEWADENNLN